MIDLEQVTKAQKEWLVASYSSESAARKFADESLSICAEAIAVLGQNLQEIGYPWASTEPIPQNSLEKNIRAIEGTIALPLPPILESFWRIVGGISLVDLENYRHVQFWEDHQMVGAQFFCDGLHVDACSPEWASYICDDFSDWKEFEKPEDSSCYLISLSPDGYHKDNISGGAPYGVYPGHTWRPTWQYFEWSGAKRPLTAPADPPDFLSYLRTAILECAGFPGLFGTPGFEPVRERLLLNVPVF